ncbi:MAG: hypothetical protein ACRYGP_28920 [Janthinobacterium lividum]
MKYSFLHASALTFLLSGCAATELLSRSLPSDTAQTLRVYSRNEETSANLIDKAMANCPDGTQQAETACVREAISSASLSPHALATLIPGCSAGSICTYDHTTQRRLGFIPMYATMHRTDWRVTIDLRRNTAFGALPPILVTDRNVFVVPPSTKTDPTKIMAR